MFSSVQKERGKNVKGNGWRKRSDFQSKHLSKHTMDQIQTQERPVFQVSGGNGCGDQNGRIRTLVLNLGGIWLDDHESCRNSDASAQVAPLNVACTHLILLKRVQTEKCLVALARGIYIVDESYLTASDQAGHWLEAEDYDLGGGSAVLSPRSLGTKPVIDLQFERYVRRRRDSQQGGKFRDWKVVIGLNGIRREIFTRLLEAGGARVLPRWEIITPSDVNSADLLLTENAMWQDLSFSRFLSKYQTNLRPISTRFISDCLRMSVVDRREYFIRNPSSIIASHLHCDPVESVKLQRNSSLPLFPNALEMSAPLNPSFTTASVTPKPSSRPKRISRRAKSQSPSEKVPLGLRKSLSLPSGSHQTPPIHPHEIVVATFKDCIDKGALRSHFMDLGGSGFIRKFISHVDDQHQEHFCMDPTYLSTLKTYIAGDSDGPEDTVSLWQEVISFFDISLNSASYYDQRILNPLLLEGLLRQPSAIVQSTVHEFLLKLVNTNQIPNSNPMRMVYLASLSFRSMTNAISFDEEEPWEFVAMISRQAFDSEDSKTGASLVLDFIARIVTIDLHLLETSLPKSGEVSLVQTIFWGTDVKVQSIPKRVVELVQFFVTSLKHHRWDLFKRYNALLSVVARCIVINHCSPDTLHDLARLVSNELQHQFPRDSPEANHQLTIQVLCLMSPNWLSLLTTMYYNDQFPVPLSLDKLIAASNTATDLVEPTQRNNNNRLMVVGDKAKKSCKRNIYGETVLHLACKRNQLEKVKAILTEGLVGVNLADNNGWTALHEACFKGALDCVKALLTNHAQTADLMAFGGGLEMITPLEKAILQDHCEVAAFILEWIHSRNVENYRRFPTLSNLLHPEGRHLSDIACSETMKSLLGKYETLSKNVHGQSSMTVSFCDLFHLSIRRYTATFSLNCVKQLLRQCPNQSRYQCSGILLRVLKDRYTDYPIPRANSVVAKDVRIFNALKTRPNSPHVLDLALQSRLWAVSRH